MRLGLCIFFALLSFSVKAESEWVGVQPAYRQVTVTGFTRARYTMELATEVAGKVDKIFADIGDAIPKKGQFSCLDDTFTKIDIETAKNEAEQHRIDILYYKKQVVRYQALVGNNSASISKLDDLQRQLGNSQRLLRIKTLKKQRLIEKKRRHCIQSAVGWIVVERYIEPGQWLNVGKAVAKVADYSKLLVPLSLSFNELKALENNNNLKVWLSDYQIQVPASIERISPIFDEKSRKVQVDLLIKKGLPVHRGGLRVELKLDIDDPDGTYLISEKALDKRFEEVWLESKTGQAIRVELLGLTAKGVARIVSSEIKNNDLFKLVY